MWVMHTSHMYQAETAQNLHKDLARHIVSEQPLFKNKQVDKQAFENIFHMLMVINPSIEVYLLDVNGKILSYSAPYKKIKRDYVDVKPIVNFINNVSSYPIMGNDPRDLNRNKIFSAASVKVNNELQGYLYIILASELHDSVAESLQNSYILQLGVWGFLVALVAAFMIGLLVFFMMTKRLRKLTDDVIDYSRRESDGTIPFDTDSHGDEVDQLNGQFNTLRLQIDAHINSLKNADRMRRELVANVSHDLRTPITNLQGYLETLAMKYQGLTEAEKANYLNIAISYSKRLSKLVSELFELARLDSCESIVTAEAFSLAELIQDVVQKFQLPAQQAGITLRSEFENKPSLVYADIGMMQRALENLIDNALQHTKPGGEVRISFCEKKDKVIVTVADTGCGIPKAELNRIFNRFYRVEKSRTNSKGAGLGLAITQRILELHGSPIKVQSVVNQGTSFSFQMPSYTHVQSPSFA